jgi:hypothetical protein
MPGDPPTKTGQAAQPSKGGGSPPAPLPLSQVMGTAESESAIFGQTNTGIGVQGRAQSGTGVSGESDGNGIGVLGYSQAGPAIVGQGNDTGPGILAVGNYESDPPATSNGLPFSEVNLPSSLVDLVQANKGYAALLSGKVLISDELNGTAATFSEGVAGIDTSTKPGGHGTSGSSVHGVGVLAQSSAGTALQVEGIAKFSRSGVVEVPYETYAVKVHLADLTESTIVLATTQVPLGYPNGSQPDGAVSSVMIDPTAKTFTINLVAGGTSFKVGWLAIG